MSIEKELILAVEKHNAGLPKDENYVDECLNYKDIYEFKELVLDDLREILAEKGKQGVHRFMDNNSIYDYNDCPDTGIGQLIEQLAITELWKEKTN